MGGIKKMKNDFSNENNRSIAISRQIIALSLVPFSRGNVSFIIQFKFTINFNLPFDSFLPFLYDELSYSTIKINKHTAQI